MLLFDTVIHDLARALAWVCWKYRDQLNSADLEDLSQGIILHLLEDDGRRLDYFDEHRSSLQTWLQRVALNYVINYLRSRHPEQSWEELAPDALSQPPDQEDALLTKERLREVQAVWEQLSERDRELFKLLATDGLHDAEIAEQMGIEPAAVHRRRYKLTKKIEKEVRKLRDGGEVGKESESRKKSKKKL